MRLRGIQEIENTITFIEEHLDSKLELGTVAKAMHYSKYHLHRMFGQIAGITLHDYVFRRQLTEAAKKLVFSEEPILDISMSCGYESQQAFTAAFKSMYKLPPAEFRRHRFFYPLQLRYALLEKVKEQSFSAAEIRFAKTCDIPAWMELMRLVVDGYPCMDEASYLWGLKQQIARRQALILKEKGAAIGALAFSHETGNIEFFGIHPQYRNSDLDRIFVGKLADELLQGQEISMTTYRSGDRADTGHRKALKRLGFVEKELLMEFGYPTQRFVLSSKHRREHDKDAGKQTSARF